MKMEENHSTTFSTDADLPNGFEQKNVFIQRDRFGYGLTVYGDNPVYVLKVRDGGAAQRAGINVNDRIIKVNGTRVTHCSHPEVVNLIKSSSYTQLTLLGPSKTNSTTANNNPQANDSPNDRLFHRASPAAERSNNNVNSLSSPTISDIKKARETFERITKQLELSKKDLERQRTKNLTNNPTKANQLETRIRLYEQQLNEIRRRLELIEAPHESSFRSNLSDENLEQRTQTPPETTNQRFFSQNQVKFGHKKQKSLPEPAALQLLTVNSFSTNPFVFGHFQTLKRKIQTGRSEAFDLGKETNELEEENSSEICSNVQSISSFDELQQFLNNSNWVPVTLFLNFLLTENNADPNHLLFFILTEELRCRKVESRNELIRWIFEIHSTFTMKSSPLSLGLPQSLTDGINRCLDNQQQEFVDDWKSIFNDARDYARSIISDRQLNEFNQRRISNFQSDLNFKLNHFVEETLRSSFEFHYKSSNVEDWNSIKNSRSLAITCALATFFKRFDIKKSGNIPLDKIPKFIEREQKGILAKLQRTTPIKKIRDHQLNEHQFTTETFCQTCQKALWGINYQGYLCGYCQQAFHRECASTSEKCSKDRTKLRKILNQRFPSSPSRTASLIEPREGSIPNEFFDSTNNSTEINDPNEISPFLLEQNKFPTVFRCASDRRLTSDRPVPPKNRSSSNPQMGGNSIDELLNNRTENEMNRFQEDSFFMKIRDETNRNNFGEMSNSHDDQNDSDLDVDVNSLPNLGDFIRPDLLEVLYQTRDWKFQTTINELIHTERTHLRSLKIMKVCFREPMSSFPGMSPVEIECIFRNLDELIHLHTQFKYALRQHRQESADQIVRNIGDVVLRFLDGENGEQFARACAYFIEDQSQALKLIKKKEQSADFAAMMRNCESNFLCRRLTLKDYLPSIMTRFTKYKLLFEAMKKFVVDDPIESSKLSRCVECADGILKRMNEARMKKEQQALLKQIRSNLEIQIPNDEKLLNLQNCLDETKNDLIYSGTLKLLPDSNSQKTEFQCCLFTNLFVFFQKVSVQSSEQRGIDESYRYILKEHPRDATNGRAQRARTVGPTNKYTAPQNFSLTPIIRLEHLLIKKKACGGARSFYVIDTDRKHLIEVEANSKDELEKWLEWIEKARKSLNSSTKEKQIDSSSSPTESTIVEQQVGSSTSQITTTSSLVDAIIEKDKQLKRLLEEKQILLLRLLEQPKNSRTNLNKSNSLIESITSASNSYNELMKIVNQSSVDSAKTIDLQPIWASIIQLGDQLTFALKLLHQEIRPVDSDQSQTFSDLSSGDSERIYSQTSTITDLDETLKKSRLKSAEGTSDDVVFDDGNTSPIDDEENTSVILAESDDEDQIEHFDVQNAGALRSTKHFQGESNLFVDPQTIKIEFDDDETIADNFKINEQDKSSMSEA